MRFAYLSSEVTLPDSAVRRSDAFEHDQMMAALRSGLVEAGLKDSVMDDIAWDDGSADWASYDAVMIGTAWDYWDRPAEFHVVLEQIESRTRLFNSSRLARWNGHKTYLKELETKGAQLIPTVWLDEASAQNIDTAFEALETDDLVLKRQIGAGADGQHRLRRGGELPPLVHPMMAQPFMPTIKQEGEVSFIYIDGAFCHALLKRAADGDYRVQSTYGGTETAYTPTASECAAAECVLAALDDVPLYARVDMVRAPDTGCLLLMELELIEPFLYPLQGPELGQRLVAGLVRRCET